MMNQIPMPPPTVTPAKLPLNREIKERLKLFYFIVRPKKYSAVPDEHSHGVISYRVDDAVNFLTQKILPSVRPTSCSPMDLGIIWTGDFIYFDELMGKVEGQEAIRFVTPKEPVVTPQPKMGVEQFRHSLMLALDQFVENEKDKKDLTRILKGLKKDEIKTKGEKAPQKTGEKKKTVEGR